jgi:hypothetical protein
MTKCYDCGKNDTLCMHSKAYPLGVEFNYYILKNNMEFPTLIKRLDKLDKRRYPENVTVYFDKHSFYKNTLDIFDNFDKCIYLGRYFSKRGYTTQNIFELLKSMNNIKKFPNIIKL